MVKGQKIAQTFPGKDRPVIGKAEGPFQDQVRIVVSCPGPDLTGPGLVGAEEGKALQVGDSDLFLSGQGILCRHDQAPDVAFGKGQIFVSAAVRQFCQNDKVQDPLVQLFGDLFRIPAGDVVVEAGIAELELPDGPGQIFDLEGFRQSQIQLSSAYVIQRDEFLLDPVRHADQVLRPVPQQDPLIRQTDAEAVAGKELFAQLLLQGFHLF